MNRNHKFTFPSAWDLLLLFLIFALSQVVVATLVGSIYAAITHSPMVTFTQSDVVIFLYYTLSVSLTLCAFVGYARKRQPEERVEWVKTEGRFRVPAVVWGVAMVLAVSVVIEPLLSQLPTPEIPIGNSGWGLLMAVVAAPVFEELICRGFVFEHLRAKYGTLVAWLGSSIFFGAIHMNWLQGINATLIALIFCYIYILTGTLWSTIFLHAFNNAIAFYLMCRGYDELLLCQLIGNTTLYAVIYGVSVLLLLISAPFIYRRLKSIHQEEKMADLVQ